jgi:hypothetical protein
MVVTLWLSLNYISLLFLYINEYNIPSHKYKFKQIFKNIGQANSVDLSYVFTRILTLLLFLLYLNGGLVNNKLISIELSDCRTIALSD